MVVCQERDWKSKRTEGQKMKNNKEVKEARDLVEDLTERVKEATDEMECSYWINETFAEKVTRWLGKRK